MIDPGLLLAEWGEEQIAGYFLVLARLSPLFLLAPLFSSRMLPMQAKVVAALGITAGIAPIVIAQAPADWVPTEPIGFAGLVLKELLVGMAFSYTLAAMFAAVSVAGQLVDTMIGFTYGALVDPVTGNQSTVISQLYNLVGLGVFIAINGDAWLIKGLDRTYDLVPLVEAPQLGSLVAGAQMAFAGVMGSAVQVAAPIILALVITDTAFGVVSRVVPQLNVFAVGFPAKAAVGMVLIGASLPFVAAWLSDGLQASVADALRSLKVAG